MMIRADFTDALRAILPSGSACGQGGRVVDSADGPIMYGMDGVALKNGKRIGEGKAAAQPLQLVDLVHYQAGSV